MKRMKQLKKAVALVLAMVMVLAMGSLTAFAEGPTHSITITNTNSNISINGRTYSAYKLFDSTHNGDAYAYTMSTSSQFYSDELVSGTVTTGSLAELLKTYFTFTAVAGDASKVNVEPKGTFGDTEVRAFADKIQPFLISKTPTASETATSETVTISLDGEGAGTGYYIVTGDAVPTDPNGSQTVASAVIITNEDPSQVINPKAGIPTLDKKITAVSEGETVVSGAVLDNAGKAAVAKVGSTVSYELDSIVPDLRGYSDYTFTFGDTISDGLDYVKDSFKLKINGEEVTGITPSFVNEDKRFTFTIPMTTLSQYNPEDSIVLTYDATVNRNSLKYDYVNNTADLEYSNSPYDDTTNETPKKETYVININIDVDKVAKTVDGKKLAGAEFILYRIVDKGDKKEEEYYKWDNNVVTWTTKAQADKFTTGENGKLTQQIRGLDKGTYYLVETKAPTGYNLIKDPIEITISVKEKDGKVIYTSSATVTNGTINLEEKQNASQPVATETVVNNSGTVLPSTGGTGTTIFYILGSILVIGAGILLITKRRMSAGNN